MHASEIRGRPRSMAELLGRNRGAWAPIYPRSRTRTSENSPSETVWKFSDTSQPPHHQPNHGRVDERFRASAKSLVILAHSPVLAQPREGPLNHPSTR